MSMTLSTYLYQGAMAMLVFAGPVLAVAAIVGLCMGVLQAVTQIQDQTFPQIAKAVAVTAVLLLMGFWLSEPLVAFTRDLFMNFHRIVR
ncbi:MAG: EscS/YscS/HrcS family type III secretion system export apparatus protein [Beijerinckiaceae bacterium]